LSFGIARRSTAAGLAWHAQPCVGQPWRCDAKRRSIESVNVAGVTTLYDRERDIALAAHDGAAIAETIVGLAEAIHGGNLAMVAKFLRSEAQALYTYGGDRGSNVRLVAAIALRRELLRLVAADDRGVAQNDLGTALRTLGERASGTARLEEAVLAYRAALVEFTRERAPLDWASTQSDLGAALRAPRVRATLRNRAESGNAFLVY
jgi:hypothetical protein